MALRIVLGLAALALLLIPSLPPRPVVAPEPARPPAPPETSRWVGAIYQHIERAGSSGRLSSAAPVFGWVAPSAELTDLERLRGRVVVINFWATWCVPCRDEMPALDQVAGSRQDVTFLAVNLQEDGDAVIAFLDRQNIGHLQPLLDPESRTARRYGVLSLPTTYFLDSLGVIRHVEIGGPMARETIERDIAKAETLP